MRVLLQNRSEESWQGGDMIQLRATQAALERQGVETEFSGLPVYPSVIKMRTFDVVHNFNFSMAWNKYQTWVAKKHKRPLVCSMIYHEGEHFVSYKDQQIMADVTDAMIFLTKGEIERVKRHLTIDESKCYIIPNGLDPHWFRALVPDSSIEPYALTVGRVENSKGQLETAIACQRAGIKYIMVGQRTDEVYAQACEAAGAAHFAPMKPDYLIRMYAHCSVYVLASAAEVMPLSVMEAMAQGAQVVLTQKCEWETPNVIRCEPGNVESIQNAIQSAILRPKNLAAIGEVRAMTWDAVADDLLKIYKNLCNT